MSSQDENDNKVSNEEKPVSTVSHKRRVHFPTDESQLRMISIAPEPLENQPLSSLGVILQRYRGACQRLQIRPLNSLLDQLSSIEDGRKSFNDRLSCLKIVNERLDVKHIDAIEEILSRCRFRTLDFDSSFSDDSTLVQLFDVIEYYESCTHLNLSNNRANGIQGYQALTRYLRKTRCLERLDMNAVRFDDNSMLGFGRSLRMSSTLYELHVESCQLNGKMLQKFIQNLRSCPCLRELYLCDNRLQVQDSLLINELIRSCGQFLHVLDLRSNSLQDNGMSHIASQLSQYDEHHTQQNSISKLSFQSNQITQQGVGFLAKALLHNRTIRSLNLSHNTLTNEGLFLLRDALLTNRTINELILRNCRLTDQAAIALAEYIAESSTIQYLDLRENNIQVGGICGMAIAIKSNKSLLSLDIDSLYPTTTNSNSQSNNNNIDRTTTNSNSLLSLSNLRKMTVGLGGFTSNTSSNSNGGSGNGSRELLEQKAKWMNDIECICERNLILYEDQLRRQEEEQQHQTIDNNGKAAVNGTAHQVPLAQNDVLSEEKVIDNTSSVSTDDEHVQNNGEDIQQTDTSIKAEQLDDIPVKDDNQIEQPIDTTISNDTVVEQPVVFSTDDNNQVGQITANTVEFFSNGEELPANITDEISTLPDSPLPSDPIEKNLDDDDDDNKRKIHHSDSLYLLRKKAQNEDDNTSDDESQLSSSPIEHEHQQIIDGV